MEPGQGIEIIVFLLEQHPLAAMYLKQVLCKAGGLKVQTCPSLPLERPSMKDASSVVVIDNAQFSIHPVGYLHSLAAIFPFARILILGNSVSTDELCRLLFLGVHGFVTYAEIEGELIRSVRALAKGQLWIHRKALTRFANLAAELSRSKMTPRLFTRREWEVVGLLERRLADKQIAAALKISERTVRYHLTQIFDKLGVRDRWSVVELVHTRSAVASSGVQTGSVGDNKNDTGVLPPAALTRNESTMRAPKQNDNKSLSRMRQGRRI
jgi:DNA-binding NarL/FixJ family response regulator